MNAIDPKIAAELDALEAALNGEPGADPALVALVEDVRATAAPMPLALGTRLEDRIAAGFPRERRRLTLPRVRPLPALGAVATVLVATVVGVSALQSGDTSHPGVADQAARPATAVAPSAQSETAGGAAGTVESDALAGGSAKSAAPVAPSMSVATTAPPAPSASDNARGFARKVQRAVDLTLRVGGRELQDAADGVVRTTQALGGYVATSNVSAAGGGGHAEFTLRVPTAQLDVAIARLSKLGHVARLDQSAQDITGAFVSVASRLKDARAERQALLRALAKATTANQIAALRARIANNRSEIARYKGQLGALRRRADLATIQLSILAHGKATVAPSGGHHRWTPADAARDAVHVLEAVLGALLVALAVLLPAGLLAALGWAAARTTRRRRREHALDPR